MDNDIRLLAPILLQAVLLNHTLSVSLIGLKLSYKEKQGMTVLHSVCPTNVWFGPVTKSISLKETQFSVLHHLIQCVGFFTMAAVGLWFDCTALTNHYQEEARRLPPVG